MFEKFKPTAVVAVQNEKRSGKQILIDSIKAEIERIKTEDSQSIDAIISRKKGNKGRVLRIVVPVEKTDKVNAIHIKLKIGSSQVEFAQGNKQLSISTKEFKAITGKTNQEKLTTLLEGLAKDLIGQTPYDQAIQQAKEKSDATITNAQSKKEAKKQST